MADRITFRPADQIEAGIRRKAKETHGGNISALINDWLRERLEEEGMLVASPEDFLSSQIEATTRLVGRARVEEALRKLREAATPTETE